MKVAFYARVGAALWLALSFFLHTDIAKASCLIIASIWMATASVVDVIRETRRSEVKS